MPRRRERRADLRVVRPREGADGHGVRAVCAEKLLSCEVEDVYLACFGGHGNSCAVRALGGIQPQSIYAPCRMLEGDSSTHIFAAHSELASATG